MAQQTAVEWLAEKIIKKYPIITQFLPNYNFDKEIIEQAKQMEKEQQKYFFECGRNFQLTGEGTFEQYYNETYNK
jgi:hypothetical protein